MTNAYSTSNKPSNQRQSNQKLTRAEFISRARLIHGDSYCYSESIYTNTQTKLIIICKKHGCFQQTPNKHLGGQGCKDCGNERRVLGTQSFIDRAKGVHGKTYDYSLVSYVNIKSKVDIICSIHGRFEQKAGGHLDGKGCSKCTSAATPSKKEFIARAIAKHGNRYDYSKVYFRRMKDRATIVCREHGAFEQIVESHLGGSGCSECSAHLRGYGRSDFARTCNEVNGGCGVLYAIKCFNDKEVFYKIGITAKNVRLRFPSTRSMPYGYTEIYSIEGNPDYIFNLETRIHALLFSHRYDPKIRFGGYTECFTTIKPVERLLKRLSSTEQLQLIA